MDGAIPSGQEGSFPEHLSLPNADVLPPLGDPVAHDEGRQGSRNLRLAKPAKPDMLRERGNRCVALEHHDPPAATVQSEVEPHDAAGTVEPDLRVCARPLDDSTSKREDCIVLEPSDVPLIQIPMPRRFVMNRHPRHWDFGPGDAQPSVNCLEVLKVDAVLDEFEEMHVHVPGVVLASPDQPAVVDLGESLDPKRGLRWWARLEIEMAMIDEHPAVELFGLPSSRAMIWRWAGRRAIGSAKDGAVAADLPAVKRTANALAVYSSVGEIGAEMRAVGVDAVSSARVATENRPLTTDGGDESRLRSEVVGTGHDVPALRVRRRVSRLATRFDERVRRCGATMSDYGTPEPFR